MKVFQVGFFFVAFCLLHCSYGQSKINDDFKGGFKYGDVIEARIKLSSRNRRPTIIAFRSIPGGTADFYINIRVGSMIITNTKPGERGKKLVSRQRFKQTKCGYLRVLFVGSTLAFYYNGVNVHSASHPAKLVKEVAVAAEPFSSATKLMLLNQTQYYGWEEAECGRPERRLNRVPDDICSQKNRIVGGQYATPGRIPWQVALRKKTRYASGNYHFCGGVLINKCWVLTAAHCITISSSFKRENYVRVGDYSNQHTLPAYESQQDLEVDKVFKYPHFEVDTNRNDIALIKLEQCAMLGTFVKPICLPNKPNQFPIANEQCIISGWGASFSGQDADEYTDCLVKAFVPILERSRCVTRYSAVQTEIFNTMFCAGKSGVDTCQGDSGGPLICRDENNVHRIWGLTSMGHGCGNLPGVYTEVTGFDVWIANTISTENGYNSRNAWIKHGNENLGDICS